MHCAVDIRGQRGQIWRRGHPSPEHAGPFFVWEEVQPTKFQCHRLRATNRLQFTCDLRNFCRIGVAQEFQRHVKVGGAYPFYLRRDAAHFCEKRLEPLPNFVRNFNGDEQAHGRSRLGIRGAAWLRGEEEMHAQHVQRDLRGVEPNCFAVTGKMDQPFLRA
jgi:hypothetical protein